MPEVLADDGTRTDNMVYVKAWLFSQRLEAVALDHVFRFL